MPIDRAALDLAVRDYVRDNVGKFSTTGSTRPAAGSSTIGRAGDRATIGKVGDKPGIDRERVDPAGVKTLGDIRRIMREWRRVPFAQRAALKARLIAKAKGMGADPRLLLLLSGLGDADGKREATEGSSRAIRRGNAREWLAKQRGLDMSDPVTALAVDLLDLSPGDYSPPYDWKHGFIPLTPAAVASKAGKGPNVGKGATRRPRRPGKTSAPSSPKPRKVAAGKAPAPKVASPAARPSGLEGKSAADMTNAERVRAAETMFGTDSPQAKAARAKWGDKAPAKKAAAPTSKPNPGGGSYPTKPDGSPDYAAMPSSQAAVIRARQRGLTAGASVQTDQGPGTVKGVTDRGVSVELDAVRPGREPDVINVAAGTPGYDRLKPASKTPGASSAEARDRGVSAGAADPKPATPTAPGTWKVEPSGNGFAVKSSSGADLGTVRQIKAGKKAGQWEARAEGRKGADYGSTPEQAIDGLFDSYQGKAGEATKARGNAPSAPAKPAGTGRFADKGKAPEANPRQDKFREAGAASAAGDHVKAARLYSELGDEDKTARERAKAIKAGQDLPGYTAPSVAAEKKADGITPTTVRRMSDDQLEKVLDRLGAAGDYDSPAFKAVEAEQNRRDDAREAARKAGKAPRR